MSFSKIKCCKDCQDREVGCHARCERYIAEKEVLAIENERRHREVENYRNVKYGDTRFNKYRGQK